MMIKIPGLIDPHVHLREPGALHKEDYYTGTAAALAGGFTMVLAMPNTDPPLIDGEAFHHSLALAEQKACCDFAVYLGAAEDNAREAASLAAEAAGLKMYLDATYGPLLLEDTETWSAHFQAWPQERPLVAHAERKTLAAFLFFAALYQRPVHVCHVSRREEILLIKAAKERGIPVTCEVTPHHLFLSREDIPQIGEGWSEVRPRLASPADRQALWENLEVVDCIATDHAPHTPQEKESEQPPPGFPGLETALPLMLTAVNQGRLTMDELIRKMAHRPREIFSLPEQPETWVEIDLDQEHTLRVEKMKTKAGWTPFEGRRVKGQVRRVVLRGKDVYVDGQVLATPGSGRNVRER